MNDLRPIADVAAELGLDPADVIPWGRGAAKVELSALDRPAQGAGRLVLVSAITPTKAGEGKTTTSVGLAMGLRALGRRSAVCVREPSLGPVFGRKGGGTGGGKVTVEPQANINLHFTGDLHAVTSAHNLLAALIGNDIHFRQGKVEARGVTWRRVLDVSDRALRGIVTGLGDPHDDCLALKTGFDITAASEILAVLSLAESREDLRERLRRVVVGRVDRSAFVTAGDLEADGAMAALLQDALLPNLVQTRDGGPAFVHGGAFGNVAHGCSSVLATRIASHYADDVVTEAGFGFDLGGEKFLDIKCRGRDLWPRCVVLVVSLKALKLHGGRSEKEAGQPDASALHGGLWNLKQHLAGVAAFGLPAVIAINVFRGDTDAELAVLEEALGAMGVTSARFRGFSDGAEGAVDLARAVADRLDSDGPPPEPRHVYPLDAPYEEKLEALAETLWGASRVRIEGSARRAFKRFAKAGYGNLPVCVAKTQFAFGDDPKRPVRPGSGFEVTIREARLAAGAGFVVAVAGDMQLMPGLPRHPAAHGVEVEPDGTVRGLMQEV